MLGPAAGDGRSPPPPAHPLPLHMRLMRRGEQATTLFSLLLQLLLYSRSAFTLTARQHLHQFALLLLRGVCLAAATLLPTKASIRWRVPLIATLRLSIALVPSQRSARVRAGRWLGGARLAFGWAIDGRWLRTPGVAYFARSQSPSQTHPQAKRRRAMLCCSSGPLHRELWAP